MKIIIEELECGEPGTLIDCRHHASCLCPFCKEYSSWFSKTEEISPRELVSLIDKFRYIIRVKSR